MREEVPPQTLDYFCNNTFTEPTTPSQSIKVGIPANPLFVYLTVIGNSTELKNAILFDEVKVPHFNYIGDSLLGYKVHFGAGSLTSNVKSDESNVTLTINSEKIKTNRKKIGALVGDKAEIGCNTVLTPGSIIGKNTTIYPLVMVRGEIPENKIVKSTTMVDKR